MTRKAHTDHQVLGLAIVFVSEDGIDSLPKYVGYPDRYVNCWRMPVVLDRVYRLATHADKVGQLFLRHFAVLESEPSDIV